MNVCYRTNKDILYIAVEGRIDAYNALEVEQKIFSIKNDNPGMHTVIDADKLEFISSAGLRVILKMAKEEPKLAIINVASSVYEVFDMTGFTDIITIEKEYQRISIEGCEFIAKGANGAVYRYDNETILKTYFDKDALPEIKQERENARRAFVLGINTAIPYGIVRVGEGYGTFTELLNAVSLTKLICANPNDLTKPAKYFIDMLKSIHSTRVKDGEFHDMKQTVLSWVDLIAPHISHENVIKLRALIEAIPNQNTLLHGDYHTNNVMLQNDEPLIVDLDTLCVGHPVFEFGTMYNAFIGYAELDHENIMQFFGYTFETAVKFWNMVLKMYFATEDDAVCESIAEKVRVIGYVRMLRRAVMRPNDAKSPARIAHCKNMLQTLLEKVDSIFFNC